MSLRSLLAGRAVDVLRGYLNRERTADPGPDQPGRFKPGGVERAVEKTLSSLTGLSRYDPRILREDIAPAVAQSLRVAARLNALEDVPSRAYEAGPGVPSAAGQPFVYLVRGRQFTPDSRRAGDFILQIVSSNKLSPDEISGRAQTLALAGDLLKDYRGRVPGIGSSFSVEYSTLAAQRGGAFR